MVGDRQVDGRFANPLSKFRINCILNIVYVVTIGSCLLAFRGQNGGCSQLDYLVLAYISYRTVLLFIFASLYRTFSRLGLTVADAEVPDVTRYLINSLSFLQIIEWIIFFIANKIVLLDMPCSSTRMYDLALAVLILNYIQHFLPCFLCVFLVASAFCCFPLFRRYLLLHGYIAPGRVPLPRSAVNSLPEVPYTEGMELVGAPECSICLTNYTTSPPSIIRILPCGNSHHFHKECIDPWLLESNSCPHCRRPLLRPTDVAEPSISNPTSITTGTIIFEPYSNRAPTSVPVHGSAVPITSAHLESVSIPVIYSPYLSTYANLPPADSRQSGTSQSVQSSSENSNGNRIYPVSEVLESVVTIQPTSDKPNEDDNQPNLQGGKRK